MPDTPKPLTLRAAPDGNAPRPPTSAEVEVSLPRRLKPTLARDALRDAVAGAQAVAPDEIARVELVNGFVLWSRADDLLRDRGRKTVSRGDGSAAWEIDTAPRTDSGPIDGSELASGGSAARGAERGALGLGIKVLDFFGVDLKQKSAVAFGATFEKRRLRGATPGLLHRCSHAPGQPEPLVVTPLAAEALAALPADRPLLVFLHGTMSSVAGSFGDLWATASDASANSELPSLPLGEGTGEGLASPAASPRGPSPQPSPQRGEGAIPAVAASAREAMARRYAEHIYAFEHRTLTESPIRNALDLVKQLPKGAQLHLVSHSRGGLVGELLCLAERDRRDDPLRADLLDALFAADRTVAEQLGLGRLDGAAAVARNAAYDTDRQALRDLLTALDDKQIKVRRFVRVACPARGTTLASGRMDRWLSVVNHLTGNGLAGDVADFLLAVVKERTDPRALPGLEAMMPGSALTRLLAHPGLVTGADLSVISGDLEPSGRWGQLKLLAVDWFYGADHDLVVNTGSMLGGIRRAAGAARFQRDQGDSVTHFNYFANPKSVRWLIGGLTRADAEDGGFLPIAEAKQEEPRWRAAVRASRAATTPRPIAVLVPGTMGSALTVNGKAVWLNYWSLAWGGLSDIGWFTGTERGSERTEVEPTGLLDQFYGPLLEHLARTHRVEILAYDWRDSVREAAKALARKVDGLLADGERTNQPVHIVAHSMGGLVARAMIEDADRGAQVWRRLCKLANSRLLMLGTPNLGSYEAVRWLTGFNPTQAKLTLLDLRHGVNDIIDIVRRFPGLVELLPFDTASPFADAAVWTQLKRDVGAGWTPVDESVLRGAAATWTLLRKAAPDPAHMVYVAGCQKATVIGHQLVDDDLGYGTTPRRRIEWIATREGDGTVPWASGRLAGVTTYYAPDTAHDELCSNTDDASVFRGYVELLLAGSTDQLKTAPPATTRAAAGEASTFILPPTPVADDIPDEEQLRSLGFSGARRRRPRAGKRAISSTVEVSVRHGDLSYAKHPVLVGHYLGDTIVSAEAALDRRLRNALSRRRDLGLYPGHLGSHAVFFNERPDNRPAGALVVGLGQVGELTSSRLETGVRDVLLEYALRVAQQPVAASGPAATVAAGAHRSVCVSCLLVGTGAGGLRIGDAIEAMLRGVLAANRRLEDARLDQQVLIDKVELLELYEDLAINAARDLGRVLRNADLAAQFTWPTHCMLEGEGRMSRRSFESDQSWWERMEIVEESEDVLRFTATTDRARAEQTLALGQLRLADAFIAQACASATSNADVAKTLFEMLLPQGLKEATPDQRDMVLLLDEASARFPWELLEDRWSHSGRPPAVSCGLLRQLKTEAFRSEPRHARDNSVFVVGNPDLGGWPLFPDLPGARREAEAVRRLFDKSSFTTLACIDEKADAVLRGLHARAWRVLHLAGHGEHEFQLPGNDGTAITAGATGTTVTAGSPGTSGAVGKTVSGMVIGKNTFLTPGDIRQMRFVPEIVFINCCHLAQTQTKDRASFNRLAANLGVEFIRMGVKAVIAAGWAVDDGAAETFATTFYQRLLDGDAFGRAVLAAREAAWQGHPGANTWGAYQCYGDPDYRVRHENENAPVLAARAYVAAGEWIADLHNLAETLRVTSQRPNDDERDAATQLHDRLRTLQVRVPANRLDDWLQRADVTAAIGFAYSEGGLFKKALEWLEKSLRADAKQDAPVRVVEQCANLKTRLAALEWFEIAGTAGGDGDLSGAVADDGGAAGSADEATAGDAAADGSAAVDAAAAGNDQAVDGAAASGPEDAAAAAAAATSTAAAGADTDDATVSGTAVDALAIDGRSNIADTAAAANQPTASVMGARRQAIVARIAAAINELHFVHQRAPNVERMCLLGSAYKRLASVLPAGDARNDAVLNMVTHYADALQVPRTDSRKNLYAFCNWAVARLLAAHIDPAANDSDNWRDQLDVVCASCAEQARQDNDDEPNIWNSSALGDIALVQLLAGRDDRQVTALAQRVADRYAAALERGASERERGSLRENINFIVAFGDAWGEAVRKELAGIHKGL